MINIKQIYWLAGLLDGEAWFGWQATPHITIGQTDLDLVERVKSIIGNCPPIKTYYSDNEKHKTKYRLTINGSLAIQWMMTIYSLMCVRRKSQIRTVIERWKLMPGTGNVQTESRLKAAKENIAKVNAIKQISKFKKISLEEASKLFNENIIKTIN